ncbi:MAG: alcohol dehydrogenase catalytic domain-containing protein [Planctomycetota bacterium]
MSPGDQGAVRAVVRSIRELRIETRPAPSPRDDQALVRPTLLAVDPADLALLQSDDDFDGVVGHRFVGVVETHPDGEFVGRRVVADPAFVPSDSPLARRGLAHHAPERELLGLRGRDGVFAERVAIETSHLIPVPDAIDDDAAVFALPLAAAVHASRVVRLEGKSFVTVLGDNLSALLCAQVMTALNATVRLLGSDPARMAVAEKWGIRNRPVEEVGLRADQDVVIDCTGARESVALAMGLARPRGKVVLRTPATPLPRPIDEPTRNAGDFLRSMTPGDPPLGGPDLTVAIRKELELVGARHASIADGVEALASGEIRLSGLITKRAKFEDAVSAFRAAGYPDQLQVVIEP